MISVKKMIADYGEIIESANSRVKSHQAKIDEFTKQIDGLTTSIGLIKDQSTITLLQRELNNIINVRDNYRKILTQSESEKNSVINALKPFMAVMQKNCEHEWTYDYTDHHKGEDFYFCDICKAHR